MMKTDHRWIRGLVALLSTLAMAAGLVVLGGTPSQAADGYWKLTRWQSNNGVSGTNTTWKSCDYSSPDTCTEGAVEIVAGFPRAVLVKRTHAANLPSYPAGSQTVDFSWTQLPDTLPDGAHVPITFASNLVANDWRAPLPAGHCLCAMWMKVQYFSKVYGYDGYSSPATTWTGDLFQPHTNGIDEFSVTIASIPGGFGFEYFYTWVPGSGPAPSGAPGTPQNLAIAKMNRKKARISWSAPTSGGAVTNYKLSVRAKAAGGAWGRWQTWTLGASTTATRVTFPRKGLKVAAKVWATNSSGQSAATSATRKL